MSKMYVYKSDGLGELVHGVKCQAQIINIEDADYYLSKGWGLSPSEAKEKDVGDKKIPTRKQLEEKANALNIKFDKKIKDKTLFDRITQQIASNKAG